jgi:hypothetical protein
MATAPPLLSARPNRKANRSPAECRQRPVAGLLASSARLGAHQAVLHVHLPGVGLALLGAQRQASAHARTAALTIAGSASVCLVTTLPVVAQTSEQLRHMVTQRLMRSTISSPRQASAQEVYVWAQSKHASMHSMSASASMVALPGWVSSISLAWVMVIAPFSDFPSKGFPTNPYHAA